MFWKIQDLSAFFRCERYSGGTNDVTNVLHFLKPGLDGDIELAQCRKDLANIREEGGRIAPVDEDIVYVQLVGVDCAVLNGTIECTLA